MTRSSGLLLLLLVWPSAALLAAPAAKPDAASIEQVSASQTAALDLLTKWQLPQGKLTFSQQKWIRGLQRPLKSQGYLQFNTDTLEWVTEYPVKSAVLLDKQGVRQQMGGAYQLQAGTELIGQLMLAVLQQDQLFLKQYFNLQALNTSAEPCVRLVPRQAPLTNFYQHIVLCGVSRLQRAELLELGGNRSEILISAAPEQSQSVL